MKSVKLLFSLVLLLASSVFAQDMDYVASQSGDTLVVKDDVEYGGINTLSNLMKSDSLAPASRVYLLEGNGLYSCEDNPTSSAKYKTIIMGPIQSSLKLSKSASAPPIICGTNATGVTTTYGGMTVNNDLLVKNIDFEIGNLDGNGGGWAYFGFNSAGQRLQADNCIFEHTWWVWVGGPPASSRIFFTNDYFVNLSGYTCRRNGGVTDFNGSGVSAVDTLSVQNCTHVNVQGSCYKFREGVVVNKVLFNHNTFVDCSGYIFMNNGDQTNMSITNNIFVNVQLQGYSQSLNNADDNEIDPDHVAMGLVNIRVDSAFKANGKNFYADRNLTYWDPTLSDIQSTLNTTKVNGFTDWASQMIIMNSRTEGLFADKANYPLLVNGTWYSKLPTFAKTDVLFTTQLSVLKDYSVAAVDTTYGTKLSSWRQASNPEKENFIYADWPIPIDLSYTDSDLLTAGMGNFPLGDLNWFPTQYASWKAQESTELANIASTLKTGIIISAVEKPTGVPQQFQLHQNYPNPFNPTTVISYSIPKAGYVSLKVYNMLGQEVATLVNAYKTAQTYSVEFDASKFASGVYIYTIRFNNQSLTHKMVLMK